MCFIDHASGYVRINYQVAINATETAKAKLNFDREAQSQKVVIKGYHTIMGSSMSHSFGGCVEEAAKNKVWWVWHLTSKWVSRALHQDGSKHCKDHVDV